MLISIKFVAVIKHFHIPFIRWGIWEFNAKFLIHSDIYFYNIKSSKKSNAVDSECTLLFLLNTASCGSYFVHVPRNESEANDYIGISRLSCHGCDIGLNNTHGHRGTHGILFRDGEYYEMYDLSMAEEFNYHARLSQQYRDISDDESFEIELLSNYKARYVKDNEEDNNIENSDYVDNHGSEITSTEQTFTQNHFTVEQEQEILQYSQQIMGGVSDSP